jgi:crotonobetainyl-CoA:carnitine CoA-transferase CaiB-like acyl-CoA transferase
MTRKPGTAVFADPQVVHRGLRLDLGGIPGLASPIVIDGKRQAAEKASPRLGSAAASPDTLFPSRIPGRG